MSKPTIFFSHSSADKESLVKLKDLFLEKTGETIDVFLSSDGQSIPFGRNWVQKIQDALGEAKIMFVFLTPNSIESKWIYFEAGFSYSKGIRVIPVGFLGIDLNSVKPPLSLLQGFNINSEEGFNNIISIINDEFEFKHLLSFNESEYKSVLSSSYSQQLSIFGNILPHIDEFQINLRQNIDFHDEGNTIFGKILEIIKEEKEEYQKRDNYILLHGISIMGYLSQVPSSIIIKVEPTFLDLKKLLLEKILDNIRSSGMKALNFNLLFHEDVKKISIDEKFTSKIFNTEIKFTEENRYAYKSFQFSIERMGRTFIKLQLLSDKFSVSDIAELCNFLFTKEVLYFEY
jgi:hypothetical protein